MWTPEQFIVDYQPRWEGGMSKDPNDAGNWSSGKKGVGTLIGSNRGVTGRTLAAYRGVDVSKITMAMMEKLSDKEAGDIALKLFYKDVGLVHLPWNRVTASIMDFGWGAGPQRAIKMLQDILDVGMDGKIGARGETATAYTARLARVGEQVMAGAWWAMREEYYEDLVAARPSDGIYLKGWDNRSDYFLPGHKERWWDRFGS